LETPTTSPAQADASKNLWWLTGFVIHFLSRRLEAVMARQVGFWDYEEHLARLTKGGDPLVTLGVGLVAKPDVVTTFCL